jgi:UDP-N-acetylglucosamine diphosphorylase/glucosamine-1-phosphate N-acetyltransferase
MPAEVVIFEDEGYANLLPLTYTRPAARLRCGIVTLWEKIAAAYPRARIVVHTRDYVAPVVAEELFEVKVNELTGDSALLVNGRLMAAADMARTIPATGDDRAFLCDGDVVAARLSGGKLAEIAKLISAGTPLPSGWFDGLEVRPVELPTIRYPWDLISHNAKQIAADFERMSLGGRIDGSVHESAVLTVKDRIHVADGAKVQAGALLVADDGPIHIGPGAKVMSGAVLEGPISVGPGSSIKMLAKIYEGTSIGEHCKIGGEVEECVFQAYSNKQHDGFMGHSFFGEWINIGADTNNSDLKNNYSTVKVTIHGRQVDSGSMFVGSTVGDHSKSGINSMFNTGTVIGVGCNIFGADFPPKYVPSFCWGGAAGLVEHDLDKFLTTAERVVARRDRELTAAFRNMLTRVFELTRDERARAIDR